MVSVLAKIWFPPHHPIPPSFCLWHHKTTFDYFALSHQASAHLPLEDFITYFKKKMVNDIWISKLPTTNNQSLLVSQERPWNSASSLLHPHLTVFSSTSMLIVSLSHSWHRLLFDTRQHGIFLVVSSTYSSCHETQRHLIRRLQSYRVVLLL